MANVLQMPLPPKARRRKTDKIDTARMLREYLTGTLPLAPGDCGLESQGGILYLFHAVPNGGRTIELNKEHHEPSIIYTKMH